MGTFSYPIAVASSTGDYFVEVQAIVDSGATYTWLPRPILERVGVAPAFRREFVLADGRLIEREMAVVTVRLDGQRLPTLCVFGDEGTEPLLGAVTLEEFGLGVDPINKRLIPVRGLLLSEISNHLPIGVNRVVYDITSKPPGTIEGE